MNEKEEEKQEPQPVIAQVTINPATGQLLIAVNDAVDDRPALVLAIMGTCLQFLQEEHRAAKRPKIEVPKLVIPPKGGRK